MKHIDRLVDEFADFIADMPPERVRQIAVDLKREVEALEFAVQNIAEGHNDLPLTAADAKELATCVWRYVRKHRLMRLRWMRTWYTDTDTVGGCWERG